MVSQSLGAVVHRSNFIPNFTVRPLEGRYLLTNAAGGWHILNEDDYRLLNQLYVPGELVATLVEKHLLLNGDNLSGWWQQWERWHEPRFETPSLHIIHLTQRCNLGCSYCHSAAIPLTAQNRDLSEETADKIVRFIFQTPTRRVTLAFQGGEPTLRPDLIERIMRQATALSAETGKELSASITTNGTTLSDAVLATLEYWGIRTTFSVDGPEDMHDAIRRFRDDRGSYQAVMEGRRNLYQNSLTPLSGSILVITRHSVGRMREIIDEYVKQGNSTIRLKPVTKLGFGKSNWDDLGVTFEEYWPSYCDALDYMLELQEEGTFITEHNLLTQLCKIVEGRNVGDVDSRNPCGIVYGVLNYDIDGKIYACHEGARLKHFMLGTVDEHPDTVVYSEKALELSSGAVLSQFSTCAGCAHRPYCMTCPAHVYQHAKTETKMRSQVLDPAGGFECRLTLALGDWIFERLDSNPEALMTLWRYHFLSAQKPDTALL